MKRGWFLWILLTVFPAAAQTFPAGLGSCWWRAPQLVEEIGLTPHQQKKMEDVFQENRVKLIDLTASVDKEEAILEPMVAADRPDADKIRAQISRVADARAELEKGNANMLLGLRLLLTPAQWKRLQAGALGPRARRLANGPNGDSPGPKKQFRDRN